MWWVLAARQGDNSASNLLAIQALYFSDDEIQQANRFADLWLMAHGKEKLPSVRRDAEGGKAPSRGQSGTPSPDEGISQKLAGKAEAILQLRKGLEAYKKGDYATAVAAWRPLAEQGDDTGQYYMGLLYTFGDGVAKDDRKAVGWFRRAAEQGHAASQYRLGQRYATGAGVPHSYHKAFGWYRLAAEQGDTDAQRELGLLYAKGQGVARDDIQAHAWIALAAEQGDVPVKGILTALEERMSPAEIAEADRRSDAWRRRYGR
jgi:hypothetical protein